MKNRFLADVVIGIAGVSIPGAIDCIHKINLQSALYFPPYVHPHIILDQPNFGPMQKALYQEDWPEVLAILAKSVEALARAGADFVIIPANTVHRVIDDLIKNSPIPILNMLDLVAEECHRGGHKKVGILGTRWTMSGHLYRAALLSKDIEECIPSLEKQEVVQKAIFAEIIPTGTASLQTCEALIQVAESLKKQGCTALVLACTELPLVLNAENCKIPVIDTTAVLSKAAITQDVS